MLEKNRKFEVKGLSFDIHFDNISGVLLTITKRSSTIVIILSRKDEGVQRLPIPAFGPFQLSKHV